MASKGGISGLAVAVAAAGGFLVYAGIKDVPLLDGLRQIISGQTPTGRDPKVTAVWSGGSAVGDAAAGMAGALVGAKDYKLKGVQPHVYDAANEIGSMTQAAYVSGFRVDPGDHGRGLALDVGCNNREHNERIAAYGMANRDRLGLTYIICNMRIASASRGWTWRAYNPITNQGDFRHEKHTHFSFKAIWKYTPPGVRAVG